MGRLVGQVPHYLTLQGLVICRESEHLIFEIDKKQNKLFRLDKESSPPKDNCKLKA